MHTVNRGEANIKNHHDSAITQKNMGVFLTVSALMDAPAESFNVKLVELCT